MRTRWRVLCVCGLREGYPPLTYHNRVSLVFTFSSYLHIHPKDCIGFPFRAFFFSKCMFHGLLLFSYTYITCSLLSFSHRSVLLLYRITSFFLMSSEPNMTVSGNGHLTCSGLGSNFTVTAPSGTAVEMNMSFGSVGDLYAFIFVNEETIDRQNNNENQWALYSQLLNYYTTSILNPFFSNVNEPRTLFVGQHDRLTFKFQGRALNNLNNDFTDGNHVLFYYLDTFSNIVKIKKDIATNTDTTIIDGWTISASDNFHTADVQGTSPDTFISFQPTTPLNTRTTVYFQSSRDLIEFRIIGPS